MKRSPFFRKYALRQVLLGVFLLLYASSLWASPPDSTYKKAEYFDEQGDHVNGGKWFEKAGDEYLHERRYSEALKAYQKAAHSLAFMEEKDKALALLAKCDKIIAQHLKNNETEKVNNRFAYALVYNFVYEEAKSNEILLSIENKVKDPKKKVELNEMAAWNYILLEKNLLAKKYAEKNYRLLQTQPAYLKDDLSTQMQIENTYAASLYGVNMFYEASKIYEGLLKQIEKAYSKNHIRYISTIGNLASCYSSLGLIKEPLELRLSITNQITPREKAGFYEAIGNLYDNQQKFAEARQYYTLAEQANKESKASQARLFSNILLSYSTQKDKVGGKNYVNKLMTLLKNKELEPNAKAYAYKVVANYFSEIGQLKDAEKYAQLALKFYAKENDKESEIREVKNVLGKIRFQQKAYDEALNYFREFEEGISRSLRSYVTVSNRKSMAEVYAALGKFDLAEKTLQEIIDANKTNYSLTSIIDTYLALAKVQEHTNQPKAQQTALEGIQFLDRLSQQQWENEDLSNTYFDKLELFDMAKRLTYELYQKKANENLLNDFLYLSEVEKFVHIRHQLIEKNHILESSFDKASLSKLNKINASLAFFETEMTANSDSLQQQLYKEQIPILLLEKKKLLNELQTKYPTYYRLVNQNEIITLDYLRKNVLTDDNTFLNYSVDSQHMIYLLALNNKESKLLQIPFDATSAILLMNDALEKNSVATYVTQARLLFDQLVRPVYPICHKSLIISPDKELNLFNFEVLIGDNKNATFSPKDCLLFKHSIRYMLSVTIEKVAKREKLPEKNVAFAPIKFDNQHFVNLPFSKKITDFLHDNYAFSSLLYQQADKENFIKSIQESNIFNLASHIAVDEDDFSQSKIMLYADKSLSILNLTGVQLNNSLVVLLGCNSGKGYFENPLTLHSIAHTFFNAGSKAVIMSNHEIDEKTSTEILEKFYDYYLKKHFSQSEALQAAKMDFINQSKDPKLQNPYYWAGLVLIGEDAPRSIFVFSPYYLLLLPLAYLLYLLFEVRQQRNERKPLKV